MCVLALSLSAATMSCGKWRQTECELQSLFFRLDYTQLQRHAPPLQSKVSAGRPAAAENNLQLGHLFADLCQATTTEETEEAI